MSGQLIVYGAGGFAREVAWLATELHPTIAAQRVCCFVEDPGYGALPRTVNDISVMASGAAKAAFPQASMVVAIGSPVARQAVVDQEHGGDWPFATLVHRTVVYSQWVTIGKGTVICALTTLTTNIAIGDHVQINLHCTIGHDAALDDYVTLNPGVHISGWVHIESGVYVGTGAVIINGSQSHPLVIGAGSVVGAGAVVTKSVPRGVTVVGVPARVLSKQPAIRA